MLVAINPLALVHRNLFYRNTGSLKITITENKGVIWRNCRKFHKSCNIWILFRGMTSHSLLYKGLVRLGPTFQNFVEFTSWPQFWRFVCTGVSFGGHCSFRTGFAFTEQYLATTYTNRLIKWCNQVHVITTVLYLSFLYQQWNLWLLRVLAYYL